MSLQIDASSFFVIAGPCVVESKELLRTTAGTLKEICDRLQVPLVFKSSYRKANRSSIDSFSGLGDEAALHLLAEIREEFTLPILSDFHSKEEIQSWAKLVDVVQIPAFLSRQTDILQAAGASGRLVNIKKGQFLAPEDMQKAVDKVRAVTDRVPWLTERGTMFGYRDLVVDFRSLVEMRRTGCPVIFDATHSVQQPGLGRQSGGRREYVPHLARAAAAVGIDGLFVETHPDPAAAFSDAATQLALHEFEALLSEVLVIRKAAYSL